MHPLTFLHSTATASDTTGIPGGIDDATVLSIPTIFILLLAMIVGAVLSIWGVWYADKKNEMSSKSLAVIGS